METLTIVVQAQTQHRQTSKISREAAKTALSAERRLQESTTQGCDLVKNENGPAFGVISKLDSFCTPRRYLRCLVETTNEEANPKESLCEEDSAFAASEARGCQAP